MEDVQRLPADTMPIAVGEHLLITKNNRGANLRNGELRKVAAIDGNRITLDNGRQLNSSRPLHVRQGYTVTSQTSQSHEIRENVRVPAGVEYKSG